MKILRIRETLSRTGHGRTSLYESISQGLFTRSVKLGGLRAAGWPEHEVTAIIAARVAGATDTEVRKLVEHLHADRHKIYCETASTYFPGHTVTSAQGGRS